MRIGTVILIRIANRIGEEATFTGVDAIALNYLILADEAGFSPIEESDDWWAKVERFDAAGLKIERREARNGRHKFILRRPYKLLERGEA